MPMTDSGSSRQRQAVILAAVDALLAAIREAYAETAAIMSEIPVPEILPCKFFNDSNLIGALYAHLTAGRNP